VPRIQALTSSILFAETHVTDMWDASEVKEYAKDGTYIHGLFIEGARWPRGEEAGDQFDVSGTTCAGSLSDSKLKELMPSVPVIYVKSVPIQPQWEASPVGYLRHDSTIYECPVYSTSFRGPTVSIPPLIFIVSAISATVLNLFYLSVRLHGHAQDEWKCFKVGPEGCGLTSSD